MNHDVLEDNDVPLWLGFVYLSEPREIFGVSAESFQLGLNLFGDSCGPLSSCNLYGILCANQNDCARCAPCVEPICMRLCIPAYFCMANTTVGLSVLSMYRVPLFYVPSKSAPNPLKTCTCMCFCMESLGKISHLTGDALLCADYRFTRVCK